MMFRQSFLFGFLLVAASCGQNKQQEVAEAADERLPGVDKIDTGGNSASTAIVDLNTISETSNDNIKSLSTSLAQFIPADYSVLDTSSGDLNLDQHPDMIMVLRRNGEDSTSDVIEHPEKRPVLILIGGADRGYELAARSDNVVYCFDCGGIMGDPFMGVVIKHGYFSIEHYGGSGWRWTRTITFRYEPADKYWYLHKDGGESFHAADPEKVTTKVKTVKDFGKVRFDRFDIFKED